MFYRICFVIAVLALVLLLMCSAFAQGVPQAMTYQGKLTNSSGAPVPDGTYQLTFNFYNAAGAQYPDWTSPAISVTTRGGIFTARIDGIPSYAYYAPDVWLETVVGTETLSPRAKLASVPFALRAGDLSMPFEKYVNSDSCAFSITNSGQYGSVASFIISNATSYEDAVLVYTLGTGSGIRASGISSGPAILATSSSTGPALSTYGFDSSTANLIKAFTNGTGSAGYFEIKNMSNSQPALSAISNGSGGIGVRGESTATNGKGILGVGYIGVQGDGTAIGVVGNGDYGVQANGSWYGLIASSSGNIGIVSSGPAGGVYASSTGSYGVNGSSTNGTGVQGVSNSATGVLGSGLTGVSGLSLLSNGKGVLGEANSGGAAIGVHGKSTSNYGVQGDGAAVGVVGNGDYGVQGNGAWYGVYGSSSGNIGIVGSGPTGGISGSSTNGYGVNGTSTNGNGINGTSTGGFGVKGTGTTGVYGSGSSYGVYATSTGANGIYGTSTLSGGNGVVGEANNGTNAYGVWGKSSTGYAGYFSGKVHIAGTLSKSAGTFKIDHPLDPANKYLSHSFVESPDMMNVYNGNITTDGKGDAVVTLPDYFEALNRDFRYQLTVIGQFAQAIVAEKIKNNQFKIMTDKPDVEVSWQVTGIRQDPYAKMHPVVVEEEKLAEEKGYYQHPELYGEPESQSIEIARSANKLGIQQKESEKEQVK